jgi:hypothetical protein
MVFLGLMSKVTKTGIGRQIPRRGSSTATATLRVRKPRASELLDPLLESHKVLGSSHLKWGFKGIIPEFLDDSPILIPIEFGFPNRKSGDILIRPECLDITGCSRLPLVLSFGSLFNFQSADRSTLSVMFFSLSISHFSSLQQATIYLLVN